MEAFTVIAIVVAIGLAVACLAYFNHQQEQKRTADIGGLADGLGLSFSPQGDLSLQERLGILQLFKLGRARRLSNLLSGETDEVRISIFDYSYTTGSGKHTHTTRLTIAALESPQLKIPAFTLRPENLFLKIGGLLGFQDIDFADHPKFSNSFVLQGSAEEAIRKLFTRQLQDFFAERTGCCVEAFPNMMIYYLPRQRRKPEEFAKLLEEAYQVYGVIVDR